MGKAREPELSGLGCLAINLAGLAVLVFVGWQLWLLFGPSPEAALDAVSVDGTQATSVTRYLDDGRNASTVGLTSTDGQYVLLLNCPGAAPSGVTGTYLVSQVPWLTEIQWRKRQDALIVEWRAPETTWQALEWGRATRDNDGNGQADDVPQLMLIPIGLSTGPQGLRDALFAERRVEFRVKGTPSGTQQFVTDARGMNVAYERVQACQPRQ